MLLFCNYYIVGTYSKVYKLGFLYFLMANLTTLLLTGALKLANPVATGDTAAIDPATAQPPSIEQKVDTLTVTKNSISGNLEYIHSEDNAWSYPRANGFYDLPGKGSGYTWMEFYKGGKGYFGETNVNYPGMKGFNPAMQIQHCNTPISRIGFGLSKQVPTPKGTYLQLTALPVFVDKEGVQENTSEIGYFLSADLPLGFKATSFGDINLREKGGAKWQYGEATLEKSVGPFTFAYNPVLEIKPDAKGFQRTFPHRVQHRGAIRVNF